MTCDECRRIRSGDPNACTRAERATVIDHLSNCAACQEWRAKLYAWRRRLVVERYGEEAARLCELRGTIAGTLRAIEDMQDPEAT